MPSAANGDKSCLKYLNITDQRFCFSPENSSQVFSQLNRIKLSKSKAIGLDKMSARLIRECADLFAFLFARSLIVLWLQAYSQMTGNVLKLLLYSSRELKFEWYEQLPTHFCYLCGGQGIRKNNVRSSIRVAIGTKNYFKKSVRISLSILLLLLY